MDDSPYRVGECSVDIGEISEEPLGMAHLVGGFVTTLGLDL